MRERKENADPSTSKEVGSETGTERIENERSERKDCGYRLNGWYLYCFFRGDYFALTFRFRFGRRQLRHMAINISGACGQTLLTDLRIW